MGMNKLFTSPLKVLILGFVMYKLVVMVNLYLWNLCGIYGLYFDNHMMRVYIAPAVEETFKLIFGIYGTIGFMFFELYEYINHYGLNTNMLILRILFTMPMHLISYKIGKKSALVAIVYHLTFNILCSYNTPDIAVGLYTYILGITLLRVTK